jgi:RHS repeat-associated protein
MAVCGQAKAVVGGGLPSAVGGLDRISQNRLAFINSQNINQVSYYIYDGHGSVRALTDPNGNVTDTYDYDAFGNEIHTTTTLLSPTPNEFLFAGEQFDSDLHLYYNRARYLNTATGRFWSMDTYDGNDQDPLSLHKFLYAEDDSVDNTDPCGKCIPSNPAYRRIVENYIAADFSEQTGSPYTLKTSISTILGKSVPSGGLMPDLIDPYTLSEIDVGQVYEIKSIYSEAAAFAKVQLDVSILNLYSKGTGLKWIPGVTYFAPPILPIDAATFATIQEPYPGVITYCVINQLELVALAITAGQTALYLDLATATLTTAYAY